MSAVTLNERQSRKIMWFLRTCKGIYVGNESKTLQFIAAILWIVRSGSPWELLPAEYGKWNSVYKRFARWCERGIWQQMHAYFAADPDLEWLLLDSTIIRAHPCAAGASAKQGGQQAQALAPRGYPSRGGFSSKIHIVVDALAGALWAPLDFVLTAGQVHDLKQAPALLQGRTCDYVIADKGYDADALIALIEAMGAIPVGGPLGAARKNRTEPRPLDAHLYKERHLVECFINKIKWYRRIFSRFDKLASRFLGFLSFVSSLIWLR
jgi:transposase